MQKNEGSGSGTMKGRQHMWSCALYSLAVTVEQMIIIKKLETTLQEKKNSVDGKAKQAAEPTLIPVGNSGEEKVVCFHTRANRRQKVFGATTVGVMTLNIVAEKNLIIQPKQRGAFQKNRADNWIYFCNLSLFFLSLFCIFQPANNKSGWTVKLGKERNVIFVHPICTTLDDIMNEANL